MYIDIPQRDLHKILGQEYLTDRGEDTNTNYIHQDIKKYNNKIVDYISNQCLQTQSTDTFTTTPATPATITQNITFIAYLPYQRDKYVKAIELLNHHNIIYQHLYNSMSHGRIALLVILHPSQICDHIHIPLYYNNTTTTSSSPQARDLLANKKERNNKHTLSNNTPFLYFHPLPSLFKLDLSLTRVLALTLPPERHMRAMRVTATTIFEAASAAEGHNDSEWSEEQASWHPVIHDVLLNQHHHLHHKHNTKSTTTMSHSIDTPPPPLELTVSFHTHTSRADQAAVIHHWLSHLSPDYTSSTSQPSHHRKHYSPYSNNITSNIWDDFPYTNSHIDHTYMTDKQQQQQLLWRERRAYIERMGQNYDHSLSKLCGWHMNNNKTSPVKYKHRHNQLAIILTPEMLLDLFTTATTTTTTTTTNNNNKSIAKPSSVCLSYLALLTQNDHHVQKIGLGRSMVTQNYKGRGLSQSGVMYTEPYTDAGLTGEGIVIGIADTGVDVSHCMFTDTIHGRVQSATYESAVYDLKYRKIVQYVDYADSQNDVKGGHGMYYSV